MTELFDTHFSKPEQQGFFVSERERELMRRAVEVSFNPDILAAHTYTIEEGIALLKECKDARDENGSPHTFIVLSNWDPLAFTLFFERNLELFEFFEAIIVSGFVGMIKPHKDIFEYMLRTYNLDPKDCLFIDDQKANVETARALGIESILFNRYNYEELREQLVQAAVL